MDKLSSIKNELEKLRNELYNLLPCEKKVNSENLIKLSEQLDELVVDYIREDAKRNIK